MPTGRKTAEDLIGIKIITGASIARELPQPPRRRRGPEPIGPIRDYHIPFVVRKHEPQPVGDPIPSETSNDIIDKYGPRGHLIQELLKKFNFRKINPGKIPPNYVHTWALDVCCSDGTGTFSLGFEELELDWDSDLIKIYNASGAQLGQEFKSLSDAVTKEFKCSFTEYDRIMPGTNKRYKRLYITLETSSTKRDRRMILTCFRTREKPPSGTEIRLVEDDVNYNTSEDFVASWTDDGTFVRVCPPWVDSISAPIKECEYLERIEDAPPLREDGWYLVAENVTKFDNSFPALIYYNEIESKLRIYLYNYNLPSATGYIVKLQLLCNNGLEAIENGYGYIFPVIPNPKYWNCATGIIACWPSGHWAVFDCPVLYPMARKMPTTTSGRIFGSLHVESLYESKFLDGKRNVKIQVSITPYDEGELLGEAVGRAIGEAIQSQEGNILAMLKGAANAGIEGVNVYKEVNGFLEKLAIKLSKSPDENAKNLVNFIASGAQGFACGLGFAGAAISLFNFFKGTPPLKLAIELAINLTFKGKLHTEKQPILVQFFLPGRFSIKEAFTAGMDREITHVDRMIPRYDRTLGLFGVKSMGNTLNIARIDFDGNPISSDLDHYATRSPLVYSSELLIASRSKDCKLKTYNKKPFDSFITFSVDLVIFNPFSSIKPVDFKYSSSGNDSPEFSRLYYTLFFTQSTFEVTYGDKIAPEGVIYNACGFDYQRDSSKTHDPRRGIELHLDITCPVPKLAEFHNIYHPILKSRVWSGQETSGTPRDIPVRPIDVTNDQTYMIITKRNRKWDVWRYDKFDFEDLSPLSDVFFTYDLVYEVVDRNGETLGLKHFKISFPTIVHITRYIYSIHGGAHYEYIMTYPGVIKLKAIFFVRILHINDPNSCF